MHCIFYQWCSGNPRPETCLPPRGSLEWLVRLLALSTTSKSLFKLDLINHRSSTQVASSTGSTPAVKARLRLAHQLLRPHSHFHRSTWHPWLRSRGSFQSYRRRPHSFCSTNWRRKLEVRLFILLLWPLRNLLLPVLSISNKRARGRNVMSSTFPFISVSNQCFNSGDKIPIPERSGSCNQQGLRYPYCSSSGASKTKPFEGISWGFGCWDYSSSPSSSDSIALFSSSTWNINSPSAENRRWPGASSTCICSFSSSLSSCCSSLEILLTYSNPSYFQPERTYLREIILSVSNDISTWRIRL